MTRVPSHFTHGPTSWVSVQLLSLAPTSSLPISSSSLRNFSSTLQDLLRSAEDMLLVLLPRLDALHLHLDAPGELLQYLRAVPRQGVHHCHAQGGRMQGLVEDVAPEEEVVHDDRARRLGAEVPVRQLAHQGRLGVPPRRLGLLGEPLVLFFPYLFFFFL